MDFQEAKTELSRRLNISYDEIRAGTNDLYNWGDMDSWTNLAIHRAWDFYDWAFTDKTYTTDTVAATTAEYYDYPNDFVSDSIKMLAVEDSDGNMKTYEPVNFQDYRKFRMEDTTSTDKEKLWASSQRFYFVNPYAFDNTAGRTIEIVGKMRCDSLTASTDLLPFSPDTDNEESGGNIAVVKLAYATALSSEKMQKYQQAIVEEKQAFEILEMLANREKQLEAKYRLRNRPQWNVPRMF